MANPGLKGGIGLLAALLLGACGQGKDNAAPAAGAPAAGAPAAGAPAAGAPAAGVPAAGAPAAGGTVSAAADPGACAKYKEAICKEAGEQSEACGAFTSATQIMAPSACAAGLADMAGTVAKLGELKGKCTELAEKLCNDLGKDTQTCAMVKEKTPSFPPDRCATMMTEYPKVLAELQQMEKANQPLAPEVLTKLTAPGAPSFGPADAQVTIVEFSDFECPYCSIAAKTAKQIKEKYGSSSVRFVFRHYPLPFHQNAKPAAQASMAAMNQGKFWEFHDLMFENQKALTATDLEGYAQKLGLDMDRYKADMADATIGARIDADMKLGEEAGVNGTPTLFIGGSRVQNPGDFEGISAMIDKELAAR